jgi:hypothetical protein
VKRKRVVGNGKSNAYAMYERKDGVGEVSEEERKRDEVNSKTRFFYLK